MLVIWILPLALSFGATATTVISSSKGPVKNGVVWDSEGCVCSDGLPGSLCQWPRSIFLRETTSPTNNGSAATPSGPGQLSTTPAASAQTAAGFTDGSTVYTGAPGSSKPTLTSDSTVAKGDAFSASSSRPGESFTPEGDHGQITTSSPPGSTFYTTTSEVSTPTFPAHPSYSPDKASPASPSSPSDLSTPTATSEHTTTTLIEGPAIYTTVSASSKHTVSSYSSCPTGMENCTAPSSPGEASASSVGLGLTTSSVNPRSTGHSTISDSSQSTDPSATFTTGDESRTFASSLGDSFTTSGGDGPQPMSTPEESLVSTTISESSKHTVSPQSLSSSTPSGLDVFSTTSLTTGHNATTFTEFPSVFPSISEMSRSTPPSGSSYTREDGSATPPSSSSHLSTTPIVSAQTTETFTEDSTVFTGTLGVSKHTVNSDSTTAKEDGFSPSTSNPLDSFTTKGDNGQMTMSFFQGPTFYKATATFSTEFSYRTDKTRPASPSSPSEVLATSVVSKQTDITPTEGPAVHSTFTAFPTTDAESSAHPSSPGEASFSPAVPGVMTTTVTQKPTGHSPISEWSQRTDSSATTFTKDGGSLMSTSSPGESFITSSGYGQSGTPFPVESMVSTTLSDSPYPTVSPDKYHTTDMASRPFPSGPGESSIGTQDSGQTAVARTEEVTLYTHISDLSTPTVYHVTSHYTDTGSAASPSGPGLLSTPPTASEQSTTGLFEGPSIYTSKPTVTLDSAVTKEDGLSASTLRPGEPFTTNADHGHVTTSFSPGSTFYTTSSEVSTPAFTAHPSHSTGKASPAPPPSPSEPSIPTVASERATTSLTEGPTVSLSPEPTASPEASQLTGTGSPPAPSGPGDWPTASSGAGHITVSFTVESVVSTTLSDSPKPPVSPDIFRTVDTASPSSPSGPGESSASTQVSGKTATTSAEETSLYTHISGLSTTLVSSETSSPRDDGSAATPSGPGQLSTTPTASARTATGQTEGSTVYTGAPGSSKPAVTSDSTVAKEDTFSASSSRPGESFTPEGDHGQTTTSSPPGSTFYTTTSEVPLTFSAHPLYSTDKASPASPSSPSELSTPTATSEQSIMTLTEGTTTYSAVSASSESTESVEAPHAPGTGTSAAPPWSPGEASVSPAVSAPTATRGAQKSTGHGTISDSSQQMDLSATAYTEDDQSPVSTSSPTEFLTTSRVSGPLASSIPAELTLSTTISESSKYTISSQSPSSLTPPSLEAFPTTSPTTGHSPATFPGLPSLFTAMPGQPKPTMSSETSHTGDDGSAASPSGPGQPSPTPAVSAQATAGPTVYTGTPDLSKSTVTVNMMVTKENGFSASTLNPTESFTTSGGDGHSTTTLPRGFTFYTISSDLPTSIFPPHASYNTDSASPAPPPSPTELSSPAVVSEHTTALTKETAVFVTFSDSSQPMVSSYSPHPTGTGSSAASSSSREAATNSAVSGPTAATVALKPTGRSTLSDSSQPTDSSATTFAKEDGNPASASSPGESFTTSAVDGPTSLHPAATFYTVNLKVSTPTLSTHPAYSTASPASLSGPSTPTVLSEQTAMIPTERSTVYTSVSDSSKSTVSSETSLTRAEESSASSSSSGQLSTTIGVSQHPSSTLSEGSAVYTVTPDLSKTMATSDTTLPKEDTSLASTSSSGESFSTIGGYQEIPTLSIPVESAVSTVLSDSPLPTVPHDTIYTTENASLSSPSGAGELISTALVSGQTVTSLPQASTAHTDVSDSSHPMGSAVPSSTINRNPVSISSPGELSSIASISGQTTTVFTEKPTLYTTVSDLSGPVVSGGAASTPPRGGAASLPSSGPSPSAAVTTFSEAGVLTTTTYSSSTGASPDTPNTAEDLTPLSSSSPIHSSPPPATSGNIPTTSGADATLFITSRDSTKTSVPTSVPSATDSPSPASPSILPPSSTTMVISRPTVTTLGGASTVFPSSFGSPSPTVSPDSRQTTVPGASSSGSAIPDFSSKPAPGSSSAIRTSGSSPPRSPTSLASTRVPGPGFNTTSAPHPLSTGPRTTVVTSHSPAVTTGQCQDATTWNGKECVCKQGFFGDQCKSLVESFFLEIPEKINATVAVTVRVTNRNFTEDLNNVSSQAYGNFVQLFNSQMDKAYMGKDFPQYRGVIVRSLLNGSIVVDHDVILEANYTSDFQNLFKNLTEIVRAKIMNETKSLLNDSEKCRAPSNLCYSEEATRVSPTVKLGFDLQEQCTQKAAEEFAQFYYVDELKGKLACVTNCTEGAKLQLNCHEGKCQMQRSGPRCLCPTSDTHWYWGETCELHTSKSMVYGSVGAAVGLLVLVVVVLTVFLGRSQRKLRRQEYNLSREWREEGIPGSFQNTDIWEGEELKEDRFSLGTLYSRFRPSLKNVDPGTELHIQRPRVVTTAQ